MLTQPTGIMVKTVLLKKKRKCIFSGVVTVIPCNDATPTNAERHYDNVFVRIASHLR